MNPDSRSDLSPRRFAKSKVRPGSPELTAGSGPGHPVYNRVMVLVKAATVFRHHGHGGLLCEPLVTQPPVQVLPQYRAGVPLASICRYDVYGPSTVLFLQ